MPVSYIFSSRTTILAAVALLSLTVICYADSDENKSNSDLSSEVLSLERALSIAEINGSPAVDIAEAEILESSANLATVKSKYGFRFKAEAYPRYVYAIDDSIGEDIIDSYYF